MGSGRVSGDQFFVIVFRDHRGFKVPERAFGDFSLKGVQNLQIFVGEFKHDAPHALAL